MSANNDDFKGYRTPTLDLLRDPRAGSAHGVDERPGGAPVGDARQVDQDVVVGALSAGAGAPDGDAGVGERVGIARGGRLPRQLDEPAAALEHLQRHGGGAAVGVENRLRLGALLVVGPGLGAQGGDHLVERLGVPIYCGEEPVLERLRIAARCALPDPCVAKVDCNDFNPCTEDACDAAGDCVGVAVSCDDGLECTEDSCDAESGECLHDLKPNFCHVEEPEPTCVGHNLPMPSNACQLCDAKADGDEEKKDD